jgi:ABC-2 type transport system ATP-binding protein
MNQEKVGKFIAELRKEKNITQQELADILGITDKAVSKWENGRCLPDLYFLKPLSEYFNVTEKELLNGERAFKKKEVDLEHHNKLLEVKNVSKSFGVRKVLDDISFDIYEGDIVGLIGPNGAGKTTLIKTILSLYKKDSGSIKICGYDTVKDLEKSLSNVGCIIESPDMYQNLSGRNNLKITEILSENDTKEYTDYIIKLVKLEDRINEKVKKYSLGMKQRLGLANALLKRPKLLILDEPTNGLDPLGIKEIRDILKNLSIKENIAILISSHILSEIENICDRVLIINEGKLVSNFGIEEVKYKNITLEEEYLKITSKEGVNNGNN